MSAKIEKKDHLADISSLSFEQALQSLEEIVRRLESGQISLEESIADYTRGTALRSHCAQKISDARLKVEKIIQHAEGTISTDPFHTEE